MDRIQVQVYDQGGEFIGLRNVAALPAIGQLIIVYDEWFQVVQVWHHAVPCIQVDRPHVALPPMPKFLTSHAALEKTLEISRQREREWLKARRTATLGL